MFQIGERVRAVKDGALGRVILRQSDTLTVEFDDGRTELFMPDVSGFYNLESVPETSESVHPIDTYYLKHARNAGAAIQALRIIRDMANKTLHLDDSADIGTENATLVEIEKFAGDIINYTASE